MESPEAAKTSVIIKFIVKFILGPFILVKAIKFYKFLEEGGKANERIEKELEEANTKDFCEKNESWILDIEVRAKELEKKYNVDRNWLAISFSAISTGWSLWMTKPNGEFL